MSVFHQTGQKASRPGKPTLITRAVVIFMLGWLIECAAFELNSATTTGVIVDHEVLRTRRRRVTHEEQKVTVRYSDAEGVRHEVRLDFFGNVPGDRRVPVRYAKHMPGDGRLEGFWPVWGLWSFVSGALLLFAGMMKLALFLRGLDWDGRPLVKKP